MFRKDNPYSDITIDEFMWLLSKKERVQFKQYLGKRLILKH